MTFSLENRTAVITGGASGIGESCARLMHERGAKIIIADLNLKQAEKIAKDLRGLAFEIDVRDPDSINALAEQIDNRMQSILDNHMRATRDAIFTNVMFSLFPLIVLKVLPEIV